MKRYIKCVIFSTAMGLMLASCGDDFLERIPQGQYTEDGFYQSDDALAAATAPLYNRAWFDYNKRPAVSIGSLLANDAYNPWMNKEFTTFKVTPLNTNLSDTWKAFYSVVTMANSVISAVETKCGKNVSEKARHCAIAEARLMRGVAYFYMVRIWGPVILFEDNDIIVKNPVQPLHEVPDVFRFIIEDLSYAAEYLPLSAQKGRATQWAAKGLLAKVYLCRSGWDKNGGARDETDLEKARELALDVCQNSGIQLLPNYEDLFKYSGNNNPESLLAMQWIENGAWGVCNTLLADIAFGPEVTGGVNVWGGGMSASTDMLKQYEPADSIRRNATFFTEGTHYNSICVKDGGYTYTGTNAPIKKGVIGGSDDNDGIIINSMNCPVNTYIIRLADVYLTLAEACLGNKAKLSDGVGLEYFNKVRTRAKVKPKSSITLDDIIRERRIEFCMEYCNWYDFVSWYVWQPQKMLAYFNGQNRGWRASNVKKWKDGSIHFYKENDITTEEYEYGDKEPDTDINVDAKDIFLPYPESDVIQNPLLKEAPVKYYKD